MEPTDPAPAAAPAAPPIAPAAGFERVRVVRDDQDRVVSGVAAGIAARLGIAPDLVRAGLVTLAFAGGVGILVYGVAWVFARPSEVGSDRAHHELGVRQRIGVGLAFLGVMLLLREGGIWFGDRVVWPAGLVAFGVAAIWSRRPSGRRDLFSQFGEDAARPRLIRFGAGALLIVGGVALFIASIEAFSALGTVFLAFAVAAIGVALVFGPWLWRLGADLTRERRDRIRSEERAEMAAHLHDSVLQTLSLIQRTDDPRHMVVLARAQERELRSWLYTQRSLDHGHLEAALRAAADRVESDHRIPVEVVTSGGDPPLNDALRALVDAAGEAMTNAAKHSGADRVAVYAETGEATVDVWVADQGVGFAPAAVPADRRGVADSIVARMRRAGGFADIVSSPGDGTEVHLSVGRRAP